MTIIEAAKFLHNRECGNLQMQRPGHQPIVKLIEGAGLQELHPTHSHMTDFNPSVEDILATDWEVVK